MLQWYLNNEYLNEHHRPGPRIKKNRVLGVRGAQGITTPSYDHMLLLRDNVLSDPRPR